MIVLKDINKIMEGKHIVRDCTFHIRPGECVGLLGKNGAGKTTLLNLMSGILLPDSGFLGVNRTNELLGSKHARRNLVYLSGVKSQLWQDLRITSHHLMEAQQLCDRVLLMDEGRIIFDGSMERILREYAPLYQLKIKQEENHLPDFEDLPVRKLVMEGEDLCIFFDNREIEKAELLRFITDKCEIKDLKLVEPDLEETVKEVYKKGL